MASYAINLFSYAAPSGGGKAIIEPTYHANQHEAFEEVAEWVEGTGINGDYIETIYVSEVVEGFTKKQVSTVVDLRQEAAQHNVHERAYRRSLMSRSP